jgi:glycosyltransferase involved in cell wall biosynthesis
MGDNFTVVTSLDSYLTGERKSSEAYIDGIEVRVAPTLSGLHRSYLWRIFVFLSFTFSSAITALRGKRPDVVLGTSPPIFQAISAWVVATLRRCPLVLEIRDLWPEFAIDLGLLRNKLLISLARGVERFLYRRAQHIIVNSPAYVSYLTQKGIPETKITLIPNGVDLSKFPPGAKGDDFRQEFRLEGKFVVMYGGAVGYANDIDCLVRAAARLRDHLQISFVVVGDGKELPRLRREVEIQQLKNVRFVPAQAKHRMSEVLAVADVCVAVLRNISMFRMTYPNKVFDYMAAGKPTLLAIDGAIREVIEKSSGGIFVPPGDDEALAESVLELQRSPELREQMGENARCYVSQRFERDSQARQLASLLHKLS